MKQVQAHTTVLLNEAVDALLASTTQAGANGRCFVDGTFGRGGHSKLLLTKLQPQDRLLAFDRDPQAIAAAAQLQDSRLEAIQQDFSSISQLPPASVDGLLLDIGVSSPQIDDPQRGFSFRFDGPLDMRMNPTSGISVAQWLEDASFQQIKEVIKDYGEERFATPIAKAIIEYREKQGVPQTTLELAELVAAKVKTREGKQHPATRTFQAFRIFINRELEELSAALETSLTLLKPGACLAVISFHSLEDRIVKQFLNKHSKEQFDRRNPFAPTAALLFKNVKRIRATEAEVQANPRSRSAIMRIAYRTEQAYLGVNKQ